MEALDRIESQMSPAGETAWFCLRSQQKREHIAAANLRQLSGLEVCSPRLRSRKLTRRGPVWFTESLFPNYLFVRFDLRHRLDEIKYVMGVSQIIHFGNRYPVIPDAVMAELRENFSETELKLFAEVPDEGEEVTITDQALYGLQAVVLRVLPATQRVQVLLELLGRTTTVELKLQSIVAERRSFGRTLLAVAA